MAPVRDASPQAMRDGGEPLLFIGHWFVPLSVNCVSLFPCFQCFEFLSVGHHLQQECDSFVGVGIVTVSGVVDAEILVGIFRLR